MNRFVIFLALLCLTTVLYGQKDSIQVNQNAIYNRPFINLGQTKTAVGGYLEGNTNYFSEDGVSEGFSMEMRRFNIFMYSQIGQHIRFLSELEFEHGTEEIALETAILDFEFSPEFNLRAGILLPAIGLVNTNHDSPNWEFVERPISSTGIIPTTLSEVGVGFYGKFYPSDKAIISYDAYLVNGLQDGVILNEDGRTNLDMGKAESTFEEDNNGVPMLNGRVSYAHRGIGEFGISYYGGTYNTFKMEGEPVDEKRKLSLVAMDFSTTISKLTLRGEAVVASIDVPNDVVEIYGTKQYGGFVDFVYPITTINLMNLKGVVVNAALRLEYADFNAQNFSTNLSSNIGDENKGLAIGISLRPRKGTVIRANYRYNWVQDNLGNPQAKVAGFQFGVASYF